MTLSCQVSGVPLPTVSWIKPGGQRHNGHMLEITHVNRTQDGEYKCEASNECGNSTKTATIDVQCKYMQIYLLLHAVSCISLSRYIDLLLRNCFAREAVYSQLWYQPGKEGDSLATL